MKSGKDIYALLNSDCNEEFKMSNLQAVELQVFKQEHFAVYDLETTEDVVDDDSRTQAKLKFKITFQMLKILKKSLIIERKSREK